MEGPNQNHSDDRSMLKAPYGLGQRDRPSPTSQEKGPRWWRLLALYVLAGLVVGGIGELVGTNLMGDDPLIANPDLRDRVNGFKTLARVLWLAGGVALVFGATRLARAAPESRERRFVRAVMIALPLVWLGVSLWVISETTAAIDQSNPTPVTGVTWFAVPVLSDGSPIATTDRVPTVTPRWMGSKPTVRIENNAFNPAEFTIPANFNTTIELMNLDQVQHTFTVDELNVDSGLIGHWDVNKVVAGELDVVTINALAGRYQYRCRVPGHAEAGEVGTLNVVDALIAARIELKDGRLRPGRVELPAGRLATILFTNGDSSIILTVRIPSLSGDGIHRMQFYVGPNSTTAFVIAAPPGERDFWGDSRVFMNDIRGGVLVAR